MKYAKSTTISAMLTERRLRWLDYVRLLGKGRTPKELIYGQLEEGTRSRGRPHLRYKDTCKRDRQSIGINIGTQKDGASDRTYWKRAIREGIKTAE